MTTSKKTILYLAHRIPFPPNKGDKIRSFNEIKYLSRDNDIHLACLVDDPQDLQYISELQRYTSTVDFAVIDPRWQKIKSIPYLFTSSPLSIPYFYSSTLQKAIDSRLDKINVDIVFCFSSPMADYILKSRHFKNGKLNNALLIMDFVDVDSDKWRMYSGFAAFPLSVVYYLEWHRLQAYDTMVGRKFDRSIFVSEKEVELFRSFCPQAYSTNIANGVDMEYFSVVETLRKENSASARVPTIIFMGAMDYYPNEDAVSYFALEVMPPIRKQLPTAKFIIVGSNPTKRVSKLAFNPGVIVTGSVPDVRPYLALADLFVAPFRIARGIQNKVLEAMAAGVPVVARPEAVQGFGEQRVPLVMESTAEGLAVSIVALLGDEDKRVALATEAQLFVKVNYAWESNMSELQQFLRLNKCN
jgi:sugar transferase (PEP-CTERM/EpsH1 system associated)